MDEGEGEGGIDRHGWRARAPWLAPHACEAVARVLLSGRVPRDVMLRACAGARPALVERAGKQGRVRVRRFCEYYTEHVLPRALDPTASPSPKLTRASSSLSQVPSEVAHASWFDRAAGL